MKAKPEHRIPLSGRAAQILDALRALGNGGVLIFLGVRGSRVPDMMCSKLPKDLKIGAVPHRFPSSFRDWTAEETNHPREVVEAAPAESREYVWRRWGHRCSAAAASPVSLADRARAGDSAAAHDQVAIGVQPGDEVGDLQCQPFVYTSCRAADPPRATQATTGRSRSIGRPRFEADRGIHRRNCG